MRMFTMLCCAAALSAGPVGIGEKLDSVTVEDSNAKRTEFSLRGKTSVVIFYSTVCPISNDYNDRLSAFYRDYTAKGVQVIFADANSNESWKQMTDHAKDAGFAFPIYRDPSNALADQLGATVTPETFVFDKDGVLRYHGNVDDSRNPARAQVTGLRTAADEVLAGKPVSKTETKAFGCTIKRVRRAS